MSKLTASNYADWCKFAGLYVRNVSHADRYRTYQQKISRAGLVTKIAFDFLEQNEGGLDLQGWRNNYVYEVGNDAAYRVEQTALALEAIGAPGVAAQVRTLRDTSMLGQLQESLLNPEAARLLMKDKTAADLMAEFRDKVAAAMPEMVAPTSPKKLIVPTAELESKEQVEFRLDNYVQAHEAELRADMAKYGDARTEPGFDPEQRMAELDQQRRAEYDREAQVEDVPKLRKLMDEIEQQVAKNPQIKPGKLAKQRRAFLEIYRKYANRPEGELLPDMQTCVQKGACFQEKHHAIFRPRAIDDDAALQRLAELGDHDIDMGSKQVSISWASPSGIKCDWGPLTLTIRFKIGDVAGLNSILDVCDRIRRKFDQHQANLRTQILQHFEMYREHTERMHGFEDYELDEEGQPTASSILQHAGAGHMLLEVTEDDEPFVMIQTFFPIAWDEEHGLEVCIND